MNNNIKVSVVVPVYNSEKYISKTLESIINQTVKEIEIICVNDGSKDNSLQILQQFQEKDKRIKIIDKKNEGVWKARMDGIKEAQGEYITFIDADDYIKNNFIESLYNNIKQNDSDIAICGYERIDEKTNKVLSREMKYKSSRLIDMNKNPEEVISINTALWNKLYKASILKEIKEMEKPARILEDMMFLTLVYLKINKISFVNDYLYYYIVREGSAMNTLKSNEIKSIQEIMLNVKEIYQTENTSKEKQEILSVMAFVHFGISLMLKASGNNNCDFKKEYKDNLEYLDKYFKEWRTTKYIKIWYVMTHSKTNLKVAIVKKIYVFNLFHIFLTIYRFITEKLKIDIKW